MSEALFELVSRDKASDDENVTIVVMRWGFRIMRAQIFMEDGDWWWKLDQGPYWRGGGVKSVDACIGQMRDAFFRARRQGWE